MPSRFEGSEHGRQPDLGPAGAALPELLPEAHRGIGAAKRVVEVAGPVGCRRPWALSMATDTAEGHTPCPFRGQRDPRAARNSPGHGAGNVNSQPASRSRRGPYRLPLTSSWGVPQSDVRRSPEDRQVGVACVFD